MKKDKIILSLGIMGFGWLFNAFAWATDLGHPVSTVMLLLGLGLFFGGFIYLILTLIKK